MTTPRPMTQSTEGEVDVCMSFVCLSLFLIHFLKHVSRNRALLCPYRRLIPILLHRFPSTALL